MPSLFKFIAVVGLLAGVIFGGLYALAEFYQPTPKETKTTVSGVKVRR